MFVLVLAAHDVAVVVVAAAEPADIASAVVDAGKVDAVAVAADRAVEVENVVAESEGAVVAENIAVLDTVVADGAAVGAVVANVAVAEETAVAVAVDNNNIATFDYMLGYPVDALAAHDFAWETETFVLQHKHQLEEVLEKQKQNSAAACFASARLEVL